MKQLVGTVFSNGQSGEGIKMEASFFLNTLTIHFSCGRNRNSAF